jgi:hypothetical protein
VGQVAARRQNVAWSQATIADCAPYLAVDVAAEILTADKIDLKFHCPQCSATELDWSKSLKLVIAPVRSYV